MQFVVTAYDGTDVKCIGKKIARKGRAFKVC